MHRLIIFSKDLGEVNVNRKEKTKTSADSIKKIYLYFKFYSFTTIVWGTNVSSSFRKFFLRFVSSCNIAELKL